MIGKSIEDRLSIYGQKPEWLIAVCPLCDQVRETVFYKIAGEMVCRRHEGHPLYEPEPSPQP